LTQAYSALGEYGAALRVLEQHLALSQQEKNRAEELISLRLAAGIYKATGNLSNARRLYEEAIALAGALGEMQEAALLRNDLAQVIYYRKSN
jgi:tetratricopeptide (TPR) repeat protein